MKETHYMTNAHIHTHRCQTQAYIKHKHSHAYTYMTKKHLYLKRMGTRPKSCTLILQQAELYN